MLQTLVICLFILPFFALIKCVGNFINVWKKEAPLHWRQWQEPEFVDLYRGLFGLYWPIIFGKACEEAGSELLIKKRNDIRFVLLIMGLLFIAAISLTGFSFEVKPRWVHSMTNHPTAYAVVIVATTLLAISLIQWALFNSIPPEVKPCV